MYLNGWGYGWGVNPLSDPTNLALARLTLDDPDMQALPEEVREALEAHKDELHSAADIRNMAAELLRRR